MLSILSEFRNRLDNIMLQCMNRRVAIYGYDNYTGRFLKWYAEYYHSIIVDFYISEDMSTGNGYDREIFRPSVFSFGYKDIRDSIVWMALPLTNERLDLLTKYGFKSNETFYDFYNAIYGIDYISHEGTQGDAFHKVKTGQRDIQFIEWLEWRYGCNFITPVSKDEFEVVDSHGARYSCSTQKEIFPILDHCHFHPSENDSILDFGCGKGAAMISFLDYGFKKVGGIEYEPKLCDVANENFKFLGIKDDVNLICGDARSITNQLDEYNWFYFFYPFDRSVFEVVIRNISDSFYRNKRKIRIIYYTALEYDFILSTGLFRLINQFTIDSRQRVVGIFETNDICV